MLRVQKTKLYRARDDSSLKEKITTFIHSYILATFYSRKSLCIQHSIECSQTFAIRWQARTRVFVDRAIEKEYRVPGARAQKIRHVCSISQLLCCILCSNHVPSPPHTTTIASCHSQVERDQTTPISVAKLSQTESRRHPVMLCAIHSRRVRVSCFIYSRRHAVLTIFLSDHFQKR